MYTISFRPFFSGCYICSISNANSFKMGLISYYKRINICWQDSLFPFWYDVIFLKNILSVYFYLILLPHVKLMIFTFIRIERKNENGYNNTRCIWTYYYSSFIRGFWFWFLFLFLRIFFFVVAQNKKKIVQNENLKKIQLCIPLIGSIAKLLVSKVHLFFFEDVNKNVCKYMLKLYTAQQLCFANQSLAK